MKMMPGRMGLMSGITENQNPLSLSWQDSAWFHSQIALNTNNIMDYFSDRSNPFFDRTCNNEIVKMQRLAPEQLQNMTGLEYVLLHVQEPILYVIRKQHRHSPQQVTPLADYYIIAGVVYQAPDVASVVNSRIFTALQHLQSSFDEAISFARYHPSKGYWWDFKSLHQTSETNGTKMNKTVHKDPGPIAKDEIGSLFQRQRVDMLLGELLKKFPLPTIVQAPQQQKNPTIKTEPIENRDDQKDKTGSGGNSKCGPTDSKKPRLI